MRVRNLILPLAGIGALLAQQGTVSGPVAGYVFDTRTQSLRTIRGTPGTAAKIERWKGCAQVAYSSAVRSPAQESKSW